MFLLTSAVVGFKSVKWSALAARATAPRSARPVCSAPPTADTDVSMGRPVISWYPGHIAKAERLMTEVLSMCDVVVELRDARIPRATSHPMLSQWVGSRRQVLVLNRADAVPERALSEWSGALSRMDGPDVFVSDARLGEGVAALKRAIVEEGKHVNERRKRRGIAPRPIRAAVLGYPNVGKSALINRLVGQRKVKSENRPGVTRGFSWIRIDNDVRPHPLASRAPSLPRGDLATSATPRTSRACCGPRRCSCSTRRASSLPSRCAVLSTAVPGNQVLVRVRVRARGRVGVGRGRGKG